MPVQTDQSMTRWRRAALTAVLLGVLAISLGTAALFTHRGSTPAFSSVRIGAFEVDVPSGWRMVPVEGLGAEEVRIYSDPRRSERQVIVAAMRPRQFDGMTAALEDAMQRFVPTRIVQARWHTQAYDRPRPMIWRVGESTDGRQRNSHAVAVVRGNATSYLVIALTATPGDADQLERDAELVSRMMHSVKEQPR